MYKLPSMPNIIAITIAIIWMAFHLFISSHLLKISDTPATYDEVPHPFLMRD